MNSKTDSVHAAADMIRKAAGRADFSTAVILGSGLGAVGAEVRNQGGTQIDFKDIPGMPQPRVAGHSGALVIGSGPYAGSLFLRGRVHWYEGHSLDRLLFATKMLCELGIANLVVTNAAGGIRSEFRPGDLMLLTGHATFLPVGESPGAASRERTGYRRNSLLWNDDLRAVAREIATPLSLHEGVYAMMSGPCYETPAEVRMLQHLGVDAVGMSTVPEAIAAAGRGISVLGISCITNVASGLSDQPLDHAEVSETANSVEAEFSDWMLNLVTQLTAETA